MNASENTKNHILHVTLKNMTFFAKKNLFKVIRLSREVLLRSSQIDLRLTV